MLNRLATPQHKSSAAYLDIMKREKKKNIHDGCVWEGGQPCPSTKTRQIYEEVNDICL